MLADHDTVIADLKAEVRSFCEARDWDQFHGPKDLAIGIATEAAELLELFRFATADDEAALVSPADPEARAATEAELADVLIFVLRFAQRFDFDLAGVVRAKLAENERRYPVDEARGSNRKAP